MSWRVRRMPDEDGGGIEANGAVQHWLPARSAVG